MTLSLTIARQRVLFEGDPQVLDAIGRRYANFLGESKGARSTLNFHVRASDGFQPSYAAPSPLQVRLTGEHGLTFSGQADGIADLQSGRVSLDAIADLGALDAALRAVLVARAPEQGILIMHGALILDSGRALVLLGRSGAGKSTAAQAFAAACDELVAIDLNATQKADALRGVATPYWGNQPGEGALALLALLESVSGEEQPNHTALRGAQAVRQLSSHLIRYVSRPATDQAALKLLVRLAEARPVSLSCHRGDRYLPSLVTLLAQLGWELPIGTAFRTGTVESAA